MSETDTTREAVERLAAAADLHGNVADQRSNRGRAEHHYATAATLRALLDQRGELLAALVRMQKAALTLRNAETEDDFDRAGAEMCRANHATEAVIAKIEGRRA